MILSRAMAWACLTVLTWLLCFVGALLVVLPAVQFLRGDEGANPVAHLVAALICFGLAVLCRSMTRRLI